tara:strand:- start:382 stop:615 length:234 start_codon:yes stop_codon:yes gene_type:complete
MNIETIDLDNGEKRILMVFDENIDNRQNLQIDEYLKSEGLEPKRTYQETRDGKEYKIYYFGSCYLDGHMDKLNSLSN